MDQQVRSAWPDLLNDIARTLNPAHAAMFQAFPVEYYWSTHQSEWATDIMFRDARSLAALYPNLVHHAMTTFAESGRAALPRPQGPGQRQHPAPAASGSGQRHEAAPRTGAGQAPRRGELGHDV